MNGEPLPVEGEPLSDFRIRNALAFHERFCTHQQPCFGDDGIANRGCWCCQMARLLQ